MRLYAEYNDTEDLQVRESLLRQICQIQKLCNDVVMTIKRYRTSGTQTIKHMHVGEGGQAIVAGVINTPRKDKANT